MVGNHRFTRILGAAVVAGAGMFGMAAPAWADTVSLSAGPLPIPSVPVTLCVNDDCATTPALDSVGLKVSAGISNTSLTLPAIIPGLCPLGQVGVVLTVTTLTGSATVDVTLTGTVAGLDYSREIGPIVLNPKNHSVTISACGS